MNKEGNRYFLRGKAASNAPVIPGAVCLLEGSAPKPLKTRASLCGYSGFLCHPARFPKAPNEKSPCPGKCYSLAFLFRAGVFLAIFPFAAGMIFFFRENIPHQNITIIFDMIESRKLRFQLFQGELVLLFELTERVIFR